jgi:hypothetical protein
LLPAERTDSDDPPVERHHIKSLAVAVAQAHRLPGPQIVREPGARSTDADIPPGHLDDGKRSVLPR